MGKSRILAKASDIEQSEDSSSENMSGSVELENVLEVQKDKGYSVKEQCVIANNIIASLPILETAHHLVFFMHTFVQELYCVINTRPTELSYDNLVKMLNVGEVEKVPADIDSIVRYVLRNKVEKAKEDRATLRGVIMSSFVRQSKRNGITAYRQLLKYAKAIRRTSERYFIDKFNNLRFNVHGTKDVADFMEEFALISRQLEPDYFDTKLEQRKLVRTVFSKLDGLTSRQMMQTEESYTNFKERESLSDDLASLTTFLINTFGRKETSQGAYQLGTQNYPSKQSLGKTKNRNGKSKSKHISNYSKYKCYNCGKIGHIGKQCPHPDKRKQKNEPAKVSKELQVQAVQQTHAVDMLELNSGNDSSDSSDFEPFANVALTRKTYLSECNKCSSKHSKLKCRKSKQGTSVFTSGNGY